MLMGIFHLPLVRRSTRAPRAASVGARRVGVGVGRWREAAAARRAMPPAPDRGIVLARTAVLHLAIVVSAERAAHEILLPLVDRKPLAQMADTFAHRGLDRSIAFVAILGHGIDHFNDEF